MNYATLTWNSRPISSNILKMLSCKAIFQACEDSSVSQRNWLLPSLNQQQFSPLCSSHYLLVFWWFCSSLCMASFLICRMTAVALYALFHLLLIKFFCNWAVTEAWIFLSRAVLPDIQGNAMACLQENLFFGSLLINLRINSFADADMSSQ